MISYCSRNARKRLKDYCKRSSHFHFVFQQMRVRSTAKLVIYLSLSLIVLVSWNVATCDVCSQPECNCTQFASKGFFVKCKGLTQVPRGLPMNTLSL